MRSVPDLCVIYALRVYLNICGRRDSCVLIFSQIWLLHFLSLHKYLQEEKMVRVDPTHRQHFDHNKIPNNTAIAVSQVRERGLLRLAHLLNSLICIHEKKGRKGKE